MNRPTGTDWIILLAIVAVLPAAMFALGCYCGAKVLIEAVIGEELV